MKPWEQLEVQKLNTNTVKASILRKLIELNYIWMVYDVIRFL